MHNSDIHRHLSIRLWDPSKPSNNLVVQHGLGLSSNRKPQANYLKTLKNNNQKLKKLRVNPVLVIHLKNPVLDQELKIIGEYGLKNKREVWRVKYTLAKIRKAARDLLTLEDKDTRRLFEGNALLRRLVRIGVLDESRMKLDYVLGLKIEDFLERRLQTQVFKLGLAKSIHHARVLIRQRHIRVRKQVLLFLFKEKFPR